MYLALIILGMLLLTAIGNCISIVLGNDLWREQKVNKFITVNAMFAVGIICSMLTIIIILLI